MHMAIFPRFVAKTIAAFFVPWFVGSGLVGTPARGTAQRSLTQVMGVMIDVLGHKVHQQTGKPAYVSYHISVSEDGSAPWSAHRRWNDLKQAQQALLRAYPTLPKLDAFGLESFGLNSLKSSLDLEFREGRARAMRAWLQHVSDQTGLSFREEGPAGPEELRMLLAKDAQPGERTNWLQQLQPPSRQRSAAGAEACGAEGASGAAEGSCPGSPTPGSPGAHDAEVGGMSRGPSNPLPGQTLGLRQRKGAGGDGAPLPLAIVPPPPPPVPPSKREQRATAREASLTQPTPEARHFTPASGWVASAWPQGVEVPPNMLPLLPLLPRDGAEVGGEVGGEAVLGQLRLEVLQVGRSL